ncbi:MAG TPA: putative oxygenase MesX, partial [Halomonas sp.]|nr:putative oxygenase MesX [Halomonas sp.]
EQSRQHFVTTFIENLNGVDFDKRETVRIRNRYDARAYQPSLKQQDYSLTRIVYDREERSRLAAEQGKFVEENFIKPYRHILEQWSANYAL